MQHLLLLFHIKRIHLVKHDLAFIAEQSQEIKCVCVINVTVMERDLASE